MTFDFNKHPLLCIFQDRIYFRTRGQAGDQV